MPAPSVHAIGQFARQAADVLSLLPGGGPGCCNIAVTNVCNATCDFCNYAKDKDFVTEKKWLDFDRACRALDILYDRGIRYLTFSGGEPLLHPRLVEMVAHASSKGMRAAVVTNGSPLTPRNIADLAGAGLRTLFISIDAPDAAAHEKNRGLPGVFQRIAAANAQLKALGVKTVASVTINRLIGDYDLLVEALERLGFETVTFTYPKRSLGSSSLVFSETSSLIDFSGPELAEILAKIRAIKGRFGVLNPDESLAEMTRFVQDERQEFPCYGGYKYFAMDVNFMVYRCDFWSTPMCAIEDFPTTPLIRDDCTKCMSVCYRDSAVLFNFPVALGDGLRALAKGRVGEAAKAFARPSARKSVKALMHEWQTLKKLAKTGDERAEAKPALDAAE